MRQGVLPVGLAVAMAAISASCAPPNSPAGALSAEEARGIVAEFSNPTPVPPRRASDILNLMQRHGPLDPTEIKSLRKTAEEPLPEDLPLHSRMTSLLGKARAARGLGWTNLELHALRQLVNSIEGQEQELSSPLSGSFKKRVFRDAGSAELSVGNFSRALTHFMASAAVVEPRISLISDDPDSYKAYGGLAYAYALVGDLDKARELAERTHLAITSIENRPERTIYTNEPDTFGWTTVGKNDPWLKIYRTFIASSILRVEGRLAEAENRLKEAILLYRSTLVPGTQLKLIEPEWLCARQIELASLLLQQGRTAEAELVAREALLEALRHFGKFGAPTALALNQVAEVFLAQGRFEDAELVAAESGRILRGSGVSAEARPLATATFTIGQSYALRERWQEAAAHYTAAAKQFPEPQEPFHREFLEDPFYILSQIRSGHWRQAAHLIELAHARSTALRDVAAPRFRVLLALQAVALYYSGEMEQAEANFEASIAPLVEHHFHGASAGIIRLDEAHLLRFILEDYLNFLARPSADSSSTLLSQEVARRTFEIAAASQRLVGNGALEKAISRTAGTTENLAEFIRAEQDTAYQIEATLNLLSNVEGSARHQDLAPDLRLRLRDLLDAQATLRRELDGKHNRLSLGRGIISASDVAASLEPDESLLFIYTVEAATYVWAVRDDGFFAGSVLPLGKQKLERTVTHLRRALEPKVRYVGEIPAFDVSAAYGLYRDILAPVQIGFSSSTRLFVVSHGPLARIPLYLLAKDDAPAAGQGDLLFDYYRHVRWMAREHSFAFLPSVSSFAALTDARHRHAAVRAFAGFGDPVFSPKSELVAADLRGVTSRSSKDPLSLRSVRATVFGNLDDASPSTRVSTLAPLPDTSEEIRSIAQALGADPFEDVFLGLAANEEVVKTRDLSDRKVLAFATHGLVPGDVDGLLEPALALSSPELSNTAGDGLLTLTEVFGLKLNADWVVLSACSSAAGGDKGGHAMASLATGFFYAGARALLASQWPVETTSARLLTTSIFQHVAASPLLARAEVHRRSLVQLIDDGVYRDAGGRPAFRYSHPIFWAPFALYGDGRAG